MRKKLERQILERYIEKGKSVNDVAMSTGRSKFTILKKAKELRASIVSKNKKVEKLVNSIKI